MAKPSRESKQSAAQPQPDKGGRPPVPIDLDELEKLGALQCTYAEVAAWFGCSERTIKRRMSDDDALRERYETGRGKGLVSLRRHQFRLAEKNAAMAIFLGKNFLDQTDRQAHEHTGKGGGPIQTVDLSNCTDEQLAALEAVLGPLAAAAGGDDGGDPAGEGPTRH